VNRQEKYQYRNVAKTDTAKRRSNYRNGRAIRTVKRSNLQCPPRNRARHNNLHKQQLKTSGDEIRRTITKRRNRCWVILRTWLRKEATDTVRRRQ